jgi:hypothetical protein
MDVATIEPGKDFRTVIEEAVGCCSVLIAIIGQDWLQSATTRERDVDFVHMETAIALERGIPVIPVLVQGASPPGARELPPKLEKLAWRNAFELRHTRWDVDVEELIRALEKLVVVPTTPASLLRSVTSTRRRSRSSKTVALSLAGLGAVAALAYLLAAGPRSSNPPTTRGLAAPAASAVQTPVARIAKVYKDVERELKNGALDSERKSISGVAGDSAYATVYRSRGKVPTIRARVYDGDLLTVTAAYYDAGKLAFIYRTTNQLLPSGMRETGQQRYYFEDGSLIRWVDSNRDPVSHASAEYAAKEREMRTFGTRLLAGARSRRDEIAF